MYPSTTERTERFRDQVVVLDEHDRWREVEAGRERLVVTPAGVFVVQRDQLWAQLRPATQADFRRFAGCRTRMPTGWGELVPQTPLPAPLLLQAVAFFREVWKRYQREDILLVYLYYRETPPRFELAHPPLISATEISVVCEIPETPAGAVRYGTLHSHGGASAYHSVRDKDDDLQSPGLHIIVGDLESAFPSLFCVFSDGEQCAPVSPAAVIEFPPGDFPQEWLVANVPTRGHERHGPASDPEAH